VARVLIVGCGCRGQALARELQAAGHAVRGTTRDPARAGAIAATGAEPYVGDPDRIATLMEALTGVTIVCWLMGTATGDPQKVAELHDGRLRMLCEKLVDTPVRGLVHEAAGPLAPAVLARGRGVALTAHETWRIPLELLDGDPADHEGWRSAATGAVARLLMDPPPAVAKCVPVDRNASVDREEVVFTVEVGEGPHGALVTPRGELDIATQPELRAALEQQAANGGLTLDLSGLRFLDSSGLRLILETAEAARREGFAFHVLPGSPAVQRLFEVAGVVGLVPFCDAGDRGAS